MKITIETASNGFIVREESEGEPIEVSVFGENLEDFAGLLYHIVDVSGMSGSRYDATRIRIKLEPGDKHSSHEDNQEESVQQ